jgi:hypothetical protein
MVLFGGIWGKVKLIIAAAIPVLMGVLYALGRKDGRTLEQKEVLKDEVQVQKKRADFYKAMEEHDSKIDSTTPSTRDELTERLRKHGL